MLLFEALYGCRHEGLFSIWLCCSILVAAKINADHFPVFKSVRHGFITCDFYDVTYLHHLANSAFRKNNNFMAGVASLLVVSDLLLSSVNKINCSGNKQGR